RDFAVFRLMTNSNRLKNRQVGRFFSFEDATDVALVPYPISPPAAENSRRPYIAGIAWRAARAASLSRSAKKNASAHRTAVARSPANAASSSSSLTAARDTMFSPIARAAGYADKLLINVFFT